MLQCTNPYFSHVLQCSTWPDRLCHDAPTSSGCSPTTPPSFDWSAPSWPTSTLLIAKDCGEAILVREVPVVDNCDASPVVEDDLDQFVDGVVDHVGGFDVECGNQLSIVEPSRVDVGLLDDEEFQRASRASSQTSLTPPAYRFAPRAVSRRSSARWLSARSQSTTSGQD